MHMYISCSLSQSNACNSHPLHLPFLLVFLLHPSWQERACWVIKEANFHCSLPSWEELRRNLRQMVVCWRNLIFPIHLHKWHLTVKWLRIEPVMLTTEDFKFETLISELKVSSFRVMLCVTSTNFSESLEIISTWIDSSDPPLTSLSTQPELGDQKTHHPLHNTRLGTRHLERWGRHFSLKPQGGGPQPSRHAAS